MVEGGGWSMKRKVFFGGRDKISEDYLSAESVKGLLKMCDFLSLHLVGFGSPFSQCPIILFQRLNFVVQLMDKGFLG